jgi:hypothetical protein
LTEFVIDSWPGCGEPDVPVPLALIVCGLPVPLLATVIVAARAPVVDGLKVTLTEQLAPAPTVEQVLLTTANSDGLLLVTPDTVTAEPPVLVIVALLAALVAPTFWLPKLIDAGIDNWPGVTPDEPVPVAPIVMPAPPLRLTVMLALRVPDADGLNATLKLQVPPLFVIVPEHVLPLMRNSAALLLVRLTPVASAEPTLVTVTAIGVLVDPTVVEPKATGAGAAWSTGADTGQLGA